ncbi:MAG TPA: glycoside hydrolase family 16 protein [Polyangiaceae bacterium]|nr:glycoside hydrolase family 16 protein [Polyangiaceae bacterium]
MRSASRSRAVQRSASRALVGFLAATGVLALTTASHAASLEWKGHTWEVTSGGMAGVCEGSPANVSIDSDGYLHLRIAKNGSAWSAAELFTTDRLGFGTYQWWTDGPIDTYDRNVVLGLFPYGPAANIGADGTNEIDIEYSRWGVANGPNGDFTDYPASGSTIGEHSFTFSLGGDTLATSRFAWAHDSITSSLFAGLVDVDATSGPLETWTHAPQNPTTNVPQEPLPLGMNLWCFDAPPTDGAPVEIVIRDFVFVPEGTTSDGGAGGAGGEGGPSPAAGKAGTTSLGGRAASAGSGPGSTAGASGRAGNSGDGAPGAGGSGGAGSAGGPAATGGAAGAGGGALGGRGGTTAGASATSSGASGASGGAGARSSGSDGRSGCNCRAANGRSSNAGLLLATALAVALRRRRRPGATRRRVPCRPHDRARRP